MTARELILNILTNSDHFNTPTPTLRILVYFGNINGISLPDIMAALIVLEANGHIHITADDKIVLIPQGRA